MAGKERLDKLLVSRGLAETRAQARALIMAAQVLVEGAPADKAGRMVGPNARISLKSKPPYVSRGGIKLARALDEFGLRVEGLTALDVGASTGGFTDCLLQRGAARVYALDVGYGQLHWKLRRDRRVHVMERVNARYLKPGDIPEPVDVAAVDVSFISLEKILPPMIPLLRPDGRIIALVKPQFEVGKGEVGKGGIVRDPERRRRVLEKIKRKARELGLEVMGDIPSPILGVGGNAEFLLCLAPVSRKSR